MPSAQVLEIQLERIENGQFSLRIEQLDHNRIKFVTSSYGGTNDFLAELVSAIRSLKSGALHATAQASNRYRIDVEFTFTRDTQSPEVFLSIRENGHRHTFQGLVDEICELFGYAFRSLAESPPKSSGSCRWTVPEKAIEELCQLLGGEFLLPFEEMPRHQRSSEKFDILRAYCRDRSSDALWANKYGWGWKTSLYNRENVYVYVEVRLHPFSGMISIAEKHGYRWKRPFKVYSPEQESEAIAHLRSIR